jgi:hypothetical protein
MEPSKSSVLGLVGKKLRAELEDPKDQPLPERWIDLIRYLDEQERQQVNDSPAAGSRQSAEK